MTDPLTYLDEVDARARRYPEVAQPYLIGLTDELSGYDSDDLVSQAFDAGVDWAEHRDRADLLVLSKALRAVLAMTETEIPCPHGQGECDSWKCQVREAITAAVSESDEGEKE